MRTTKGNWTVNQEGARQYGDALSRLLKAFAQALESLAEAGFTQDANWQDGCRALMSNYMDYWAVWRTLGVAVEGSTLTTELRGLLHLLGAGVTWVPEMKAAFLELGTLIARMEDSEERFQRHRLGVLVPAMGASAWVN